MATGRLGIADLSAAANTSLYNPSQIHFRGNSIYCVIGVQVQEVLE